jgi:hypothetical protein
VGDSVGGDGLSSGGAAVGDPTGVGEPLVGVADGLGVCDGLGDRVGLGEVPVGLVVGVAGAEGLVVDWLDPVGSAAGTGRTRM